MFELTLETVDHASHKVPPYVLATFHLLNFFYFFRKLEDLSVDEFLLSGDLDSADGGDSEEETPKQNGLSKKSKKKDVKSAASKM